VSSPKVAYGKINTSHGEFGDGKKNFVNRSFNFFIAAPKYFDGSLFALQETAIHQINYLLFQRTRIDPFNDLGEFIRSQLSKVITGLLYFYKQTIDTITGHDHYTRFPTIHCVGIGAQIQTSGSTRTVTSTAFGLEDRADGVIPCQG
jgi:hypothetical protein